MNPRTTKFNDPATFRETQAQRIIARFGGARQLHAAMAGCGHRVNLATIYRWDLPKSKGGRGGVLPSWRLAQVIDTANRTNVALSAVDLDPRPL